MTAAKSTLRSSCDRIDLYIPVTCVALNYIKEATDQRKPTDIPDILIRKFGHRDTSPEKHTAVLKGGVGGYLLV